jgi:maltose alpha-D-glucosyltransferase/alpha-amylase
MDNDRRRIELLNSILLTMPGSPIVYYGDEIAMGDNVWLGDRDGVRTPMQWSPDRNAGFSRADPARLYLPVISDSVYGFQALNVEAEERSQFSLLNWMKRLIQVRKQHRAFGRGSVEFLRPENETVLVYLREYEDEVVLVVNNLSETAQAVRLDLSRFAGRVPVELIGRSEFPVIDETPYALTLSPYSFFWFSLRPVREATEMDPEALHRLGEEWRERDQAILSDPELVSTIVCALPLEWIQAQRWFRQKTREIKTLELVDHAVVVPEAGACELIAVLRIHFQEGDSELYLVPLALRPPLDEREAVKPFATVATRAGEVELYEALIHRRPVHGLLRLVKEEDELLGKAGSFRGNRVGSVPLELREMDAVRPIDAEQSNSSLVVGDRLMLKLFRRLEPGLNPDLEISRFLLESTDFRALPALAGWIDYRSDVDLYTAVAGVFEFIPGASDAWAYTQKNLDRYLAAASRSAADPWSVAGQASLRRMATEYLASAVALGELTGELHRALGSAGPEHPDFQPEAVTDADAAQWILSAQGDVSRTFDDFARRVDAIPGAFPAEHLRALSTLARSAPDLRERVEALRDLAATGAVKTRIHGDYHLGQVLRRAVADGGPQWLVIDFEGEPARPLDERRGKYSPLRDVAGMLRSFDYAVRTAIAEQKTTDLIARANVRSWGQAWLEAVRSNFLNAYRRTLSDTTLIPPDEATFQRVLSVFELEKAVYELGYEMNNRPHWIWIPLEGIQAILERNP